MFGNRKTPDFAKIISDLMDRVARISEENGRLAAENLALEKTVDKQQARIEELGALNASLADQRDTFLHGARQFGLNLEPLLDRSDLFNPRGFELAAAVVRPVVETLSIPYIEEAQADERYHQIMMQTPGFDPNQDLQEEKTANHYGYTRMVALRFFVKSQ